MSPKLNAFFQNAYVKTVIVSAVGFLAPLILSFIDHQSVIDPQNATAWLGASYVLHNLYTEWQLANPTQAQGAASNVAASQPVVK